MSMDENAPQHTEGNVAQPSLVQKLKQEIDWDEFKRKAMLTVMHCTSGKNPLDYYLADVAVSYWMENLDKAPEEMIAMLEAIDLPEPDSTDEGYMGVEGEPFECTPLASDNPAPQLAPITEQDAPTTEFSELDVVNA